MDIQKMSFMSTKTQFISKLWSHWITWLIALLNILSSNLTAIFLSSLIPSGPINGSCFIRVSILHKRSSQINKVKVKTLLIKGKFNVTTLNTAIARNLINFFNKLTFYWQLSSVNQMEIEFSSHLCPWWVLCSVYNSS